MTHLPRVLVSIAIAALCFSTGSAFAQAYPNKPIRWVVAWPAGGGTDIAARTIAPRLSASLGQPIVIDNRPGATGIIGAEFAARSAADGYTIYTGDNGTLTLTPHLYQKLSFDPARDFQPVSLFGKFPMLLVVHSSVPANSMKELVELARKQPGKINYGSFGLGSVIHLAMEIVSRQSGIQMVHVPYKGAAPAVQDLLGGQVSTMFLDLASGMTQIRAGKVRALAVSTKERLAALPDLPTVAESGIDGFDAFYWQGLMTPAGVPRDVVIRLNQEMLKVMAAPEVIKRFNELGFVPISSSPEEFADLRVRDTQKWGEIVKTLGIKLD